eukprot:m.436697 g.436697  ORF g.436697 m.436697 type:complete len:80 (+) comp56776_c0_seq10:1494-1733(+)
MPPSTTTASKRFTAANAGEPFRDKHDCLRISSDMATQIHPHTTLDESPGDPNRFWGMLCSTIIPAFLKNASFTFICSRR